MNKLKCIKLPLPPKNNVSIGYFSFINEETNQVVLFNGNSVWESITDFEIDAQKGYSNERVMGFSKLIPNEFNIDKVIEKRQLDQDILIYNELKGTAKILWLKDNQDKYRLMNDYEAFWVEPLDSDLKDYLEESDEAFKGEEWGWKEILDLLTLLGVAVWVNYKII